MYDEELPKWIVYVGSTSAKEMMLYKGKDSSDLRGERFVWVLLFTDIVVDTANVNTSLSILRTDYSVGPAEKMLRAIGGILPTLKSNAAIPATPATPPVEDTQDPRIPLTFHNVVSTKAADCVLRVASARLSLSENSVARMIISPSTGTENYSLIGNQSNARLVMRELTVGDRSYLGASMALGFTFEHLTLQHSKQKSVTTTPDLYLLANIYFFPHPRSLVSWSFDGRPRFGSKAPSWGWAIGTNLGIGTKGQFLDEIVIGMTIGHILGSGGVVLGDSLSNWANKVKHRAFLGLNLSL
jgi:hypothetical protein